MNNSMTPPPKKPLSSNKKKVRDSNLELYRIIVMLLIVAHHYVVNSGLLQAIGENPNSPSAIPMLLLGAWGKTGINCFILITGYFMCRTGYTLTKLLRLYLQVIFYTVVIYAIFLIAGRETVTVKNIFRVIVPIFDLTPNNFVGCFLVFYLFIPFLNILINNMSKKEHGRLTILAVSAYSILPSLSFKLPINYISWFSILYLIASYIRLYNFPIKISHRGWGYSTLFTLILSSLSVITMIFFYKRGFFNEINVSYYFISDSNKFLALSLALSSFMYFKDLNIPYSRIINILGSATFGVLLIHANSDAMRQWLWKDTVNSIGHWGGDILFTFGYALISIILIYVICSGIEWFRQNYTEKYILNFFDRIIHRFLLIKR